MLKVDNRVINASVLDILKELRWQLNQNNIDKLKDIKPNGNNVQITCPHHKGGKESKPSAGVTMFDDAKVDAGTCHCFTCGYVATLPELVSECFGYEDGGRFGTKWLLTNFSNSDLRQRTKIEFHNRGTKKISKYVSDEELANYRFYHPYMFKRKLTEEIICEFDVGYDKKTNCITFPVRDENGNCVFIARRSVQGKFFNYPTEVSKPVYGFYKIPKTVKEVIVCESIINALTCWTYGEYAVALLGTGTNEQYEILRKSHIRKFILGFDGDSAGDNACIRFKKALGDRAIITKLNIPRNKDINDLTEKEYFELKEKYF